MVDPGRLVDRGVELGRLRGLWDSGEPGLVVVYGRRRVGKTRLLLEWLRGRRHAYYQAGLWGGSANLEGLVEAAAEGLGLPVLREASPRGLRGFFQLLAGLLGGERAAVVIDEFTYWLRVEPGVVSELQYVVDHVLPGTRLLVVLAGSLVGLMQREVVGGGSPLYGRARLRLRLGELAPWCTPFFAPRYGARELVEAYALLGGVPFYLRLLDDSLEPLEAFLALFGPGGVLEDEPLFLLREEFRDPHPYLALLRALAQGARRPGEAAQLAGLPSSHATRYLHVLADLGLVEAEPLLFQRRRRLYRVADKALASWLRVVEPIRHLLSEGAPGAREEAARRAGLRAAEAWEELARLHALSVLAPGLGIRPVEAGRLIHRGEEVDFVALDHGSRQVLAVEAKWGTLGPGEAEAVARRTLAKLHAALPTRLHEYRVHVAIYAAEARGEQRLPDWATLVTAEQLPWRRGCR